ncbi:MAG TPA: DUF58 domain-containing protein [Saprospiraceae bacterium]|nr:DUF58 domain-containing protein [Saprospiraceae bacterium]HMP15009.1 DUF58 domain-containing protein [Saprospiraceae bacterium]
MITTTLKQLFLTNRLFWMLGALAALFVLSFAVPPLFVIAQILLLLAIVLIVLDVWFLFNPSVQVAARRRTPKLLSLGDFNQIYLDLQNRSSILLTIQVIDELPVQFQIRDFVERIQLPADTEHMLTYPLRPTTRGEYGFGAIHLYLNTALGFIERRVSVDAAVTVPVYPSVIQMRQYELRAFHRVAQFQGIKKLRRIGHSYEFEQIKNYVRGDDYRSINWKASSRRAELMVNQYEDERAQQVYSIIDKSRVMRLPFNGLSLMDYAINATLALSNIALKKYDRAGLITFSDVIGATIKADSKTTQLQKILSALYKEQERILEANYELLYHAVHTLVSRRSLLLLYTNFESRYALERVLPLLRRINKFHLLVVIFFENTEIRNFARQPAHTLEDIYHQTVAQQFLSEKVQMVQILRQHGIQAVCTSPEDLSMNTINKYLELKSRGLI